MNRNQLEQLGMLSAVEKLERIFGKGIPVELQDMIATATALGIGLLAKDARAIQAKKLLEELCRDFDINATVVETREPVKVGTPKKVAVSGPSWEDRVDEFMDWCQRGKALLDVVKWAKEGIESQKILSEEDLKTLFELPGDPVDPKAFVAKRAANDLHIFLKSAKAGIKGTRNPYILQKLYELALEREDEIFENAHKAFPTMVKRP